MVEDPGTQTLVSTDRQSDPGSSGSQDRNSGAISLGALAVDELVAGRFRIRWLSGSGAMGDLYRATDLTMGQDVALKVSRSDASHDPRFVREAECLAEIEHPGIPAYVSHGRTQNGLPFLAMEWLDGTTLTEHLERNRLSPRAAVELIELVAEAISAAHEAGVVHRDINPRNIFLVDERSNDVRVLDFGVAQVGRAVEQLTAVGSQIGTPGYMAPEQVEVRGKVSPAADVFALGCILFELITGERAFYAPTLAEVLARILRDEPPRLRDFSAALPEQLDTLVARCLAKDPLKRPSNAQVFLDWLAHVPPLEDSAIHVALPSIPPQEVELVPASVVVTRGDFELAEEVLAPLGLVPREGDDGTIAVSTLDATHFEARGAKDHARLAAHVALSLASVFETTQVSVATGLMQAQTLEPVGRAYDRALVELFLQEEEPQGQRILLDAATANFLDARFGVRREPDGCVLVGLEEEPEAGRFVGDRLSPFVGRSAEIAALEALFEDCRSESHSTAALIVGEEGSGKTRTVHEFCSRLPQGARVWRCCWLEHQRATDYGQLLAACLRAAGISSSARAPECQGRLRDWLSPVLQERAEPVSEHIGWALERGGALKPNVTWEPLLPEQLDRLGRSLLHCLHSECSSGPVVVILDDLQWADRATLAFVKRALSELSGDPLLFLGLVRASGPAGVWEQERALELRLRPLGKAAATKLISSVACAEATPDVEDVLGRAGGNPYRLEELLRSCQDGQGEAVPEGILLQAQSRLCSLDADCRRALRTLSVLGPQVWSGAASYLAGPRGLSRAVDSVMEDLIRYELLVAQPDSRFPAHAEYEFASRALRTAAYSLLSEEEKEAAHCRAAEWLEAFGASEALPVATHYTLGGEYERARLQYLRAGQHALVVNDLEAAASCAEEGLAAGSHGEEAVELRLIQAEVCRWRGDNSGALRAAQAAYGRAALGSLQWFVAASEVARASGAASKVQAVVTIADAVRHQELAESDEQLIALCQIADELGSCGREVLALHLLRAVDRALEDRRASALLQAHRLRAEASCLQGAGRMTARIELAEAARVHFKQAGDQRGACEQRLRMAVALGDIGDAAGAHDVVLTVLGRAEDLQLSAIQAKARVYFGRTLARVKSPEQALSHLQEASSRLDMQRNRRWAGKGRLYLAELQLMADAPGAALEAAQHAASLLAGLPEARIGGLGLQLMAYVQGDAASEAHALAESASEVWNNGPEASDLTAWLALALASYYQARGVKKRALRVVEGELERQRSASENLPAHLREAFETGCPARTRLLNW